MLRALTVAALVLALGAGAAPARDAGGNSVAFVAVPERSQLVAVDLTTQQSVRRIALPPKPWSVASTGDLRFLLVTSPSSGTVTMLDSFTGQAVRTFAGFGRPLDVEIGLDGQHAFVTDARTNFLAIVDLELGSVAARVVVPRTPQSVAAGDVALVTHAPPNPYVTVIGLGVPGPLRPSWSPRLAVPAEGGALDIVEQPDSAYAYVTGRHSGGVAKIDWGHRGSPMWWRRVAHGSSTSRSTTSRVAVSGRAMPRAVRCLPCRARRDASSAGSAAAPGPAPIALGGQAYLVATCRDAMALAIWETRTWRRTLVPLGGRPHGVAVAVVP